MTKEILIPLIEEGLSTYAIGKKLNLSNSTIIYWIKSLDLTELYKTRTPINSFKLAVNSKYTKENIEELAKQCNSLTELIEKFGIVARGRNFDTIKKYIKEYNIDISHFNKNIKRKGLFRCKTVNDYLVLDSNIGSSQLKDKLYKNNLKTRECELCGQNETWNGKTMSLILDHINGNHKDNRLENLRIVCPNCNATLDTHCGKHKKTITKDKLIAKENERLLNNGRTIKEKQNDLNKRKAERPTKEILITQIKELGYVGTAKLYNVSNNSIKKWLKYY